MKKLLPFLFIFSLTLSCCKRDDEPETFEIYMPQDFKDYSLFKVGTYWVYENNNTNELDSVSVEKSLNNIDKWFNSNFNHEITFEIIDYVTYSSFENFNIRYYNSSPIPENPNSYFPQLRKIKAKPGDYVGETTVTFHPFDTNKTLYLSGTSPNGQLKLNKIHDTYKVGNIEYVSVLEFYNTEDLTTDKKEVRYFFAKNIGLIKKENITDSITWNLIRYNIVQ